MNDLTNKVVVVTGGSMGIGLETVKLFAKEGAKIVIVARGEDTINNAIGEIAELGGNAVGIPTDVSDINQVEDMVGVVLDEFGSIDILINNAAVINWDRNFIDVEPSEWQSEVAVNLTGLLNVTHSVLPHMMEQKDGVIVNISSVAGKTGEAGLAVYSATKFAVLGFTQALAQEVEETGVRVYAVCPGMTKTRMTNYEGMESGKVAQRIFDVACEQIDLAPGEDSEINS